MSSAWEVTVGNTGMTVSKVPEVTLVFWIIKIAATTLGETGGDALSMSMNLGYLVSSAIFAAIFVGAVALQIRAKQFHPLVYWTTIIASTTVGTTLADFTDRSLSRLYRAPHDDRNRARWLPGVDLKVRTATAEKSMRITWPDKTSVEVGFASKGPAKSLVAVQHGKLPDKAAAARLKDYWTERFGALEEMLGSE